MKKNGDEIRISTSNITLRAIGFVIALVVAVCAFSFGIASIGNKEPGYYEIEASASEQAERYALGFTLNLYLDGESNAIKEQMAQAQEVYSTSLLRAYMLLDVDNTYDGVVNLATLNASLGQTVEVGDELCAILADAWEKTQQGGGYNLFSGVLVHEWESILTVDQPLDYDPLTNDNSAQRISALAMETARLTHFDLTAENGCVTVRVSEDYLSFLRENEYELCILNTNLLREAYLARIVCDALEQAGFTNGYLVTDSGLTVSLSTHESGKFCLYTHPGDEAVLAATVDVMGGAVCSTLRSFPLSDGEFRYYSVENYGKTVHRSPLSVLSDGVMDTALQSGFVVRTDGDIVRAAYESVLLAAQKDAESLTAAAALLDGAEVACIAWGGALHATSGVDVLELA